jgi:hypothetical protein
MDNQCPEQLWLFGLRSEPAVARPWDLHRLLSMNMLTNDIIVVVHQNYVYDSDEFQEHSNKFSRLTRRNSTLHKQRKNSEDFKLSDKDENEFQSNITLMRNLKRIILKVSRRTISKRNALKRRPIGSDL